VSDDGKNALLRKKSQAPFSSRNGAPDARKESLLRQYDSEITSGRRPAR